ncbi:hypothetical protein [Kitasatospora sp. NPDC097643]|uniref:hypothetical protein n=1 Tax=Kitasatospora sp. NPDC097643 TaxID=3157230 RepID=UPI00331A9ACB
MVVLSTALVAAVLVAVAAVRRAPAPGLEPAAAEPAPGRLAYVNSLTHRALVLATGPRPAVTPLFGVGVAGNDCQPSVRGDTVVWVSDRSGTGEQLMKRQGAGPAVPFYARNGWRLMNPALSPDGRTVAFTSWQQASDGDDWCRQGQRSADPTVAAASSSDASATPSSASPTPSGATPTVWVVGVDGGEPRPVSDGRTAADWATWSPDGTALAYEQDGRLYRAPAQGGTPQLVATGGKEAHRPSWEPTAGTGHDRLAFLTPGNETLTVNAVPARHDGPVEVLASSSTGSTDGAVAWSPDGSALALVVGSRAYRVAPVRPCDACTGEEIATNSEGFDSVAWYTPPGGSPTVLLTRPDPYYGHLESMLPRPPLDRLDLLPGDLASATDYRDPAYSPDGRRLAFVSVEYYGDGAARSRIMVGDPDDLAHAVALPTALVDPGMDYTRPAWSPDGTELAFGQADRNTAGVTADAAAPNPGRVVVVSLGADPATASLRYAVPRLSRNGYRCQSLERDPTWSADGSRIAFSRQGSCVPIVNVRAATGGSSSGPAPTSAGTAGPPPAALAAPVNGTRHVWSVDARDGGDQRDLTAAQCGEDCPVSDERPAYAPAGDRLAVSRVLLTAENTGTPTPGAPPPAAGYRVLVTMAGNGQGCRTVVPWTGACPTVSPRVPPDTASPFRTPIEPAWSPDGTRLAFRSHGKRIGIADATTGQGQELPDRYSSQQSAPTWQATADLDVALTADQPQLTEGATGDLTLTVTNLGPAPATAPTGGELTLPPGLQGVGAPRPSQGSCSATAPYSCAFGTLAGGASATVHLTVRATALGSQQVTGQATTRLTDPRPENNRAQVTVTVVAPKLPDPAVTATVTPATVRTGEPATIEFTVRNRGDATAYAVTLTPTVPPGLTVTGSTPACPATGCVLGTLAAGEEKRVSLVVTAATPLTATVLGTVSSEGRDSDPGNNTVTVTLTVTDRATPPPTSPPPSSPTVTPTATPTTTPAPPPPAPRADPAVGLTVDPATAYVGGTVTARVTVRDLGAAPATGATLVTALPPGATLLSAPPGCTPAACPIGDLAPGAETVVTFTLTPTAPSTGTVTATLTTTGDDLTAANDTATAALTVRRPTVTLSPPVGPPGVVTLAYGADFPPGTEVTLRWSAGVTAAAAPVRVGADGTFTAPVLVLVQDTLGPRELVTTPAAAGPPAFGEVRTGFTVVPGVLQPRPYEWRR